MFKFILLLFLTTLLSCCNNSSEDTKNIPVSTYSGTVIGLSVEPSMNLDKYYFEILDQYDQVYRFRYKHTKLEIGDSIKYCSSSTDNSTNLGSITVYGKSKHHGKKY